MCVCALAQKFGPTAVSAAAELEVMALCDLDVGAQRAAIFALFEVDPIRTTELFLKDDSGVRGGIRTLETEYELLCFPDSRTGGNMSTDYSRADEASVSTHLLRFPAY